MPVFTPQQQIAIRANIGRTLTAGAQQRPATSALGAIGQGLSGLAGGLTSSGALKAGRENSQLQNDALAAALGGDTSLLAGAGLGKLGLQLSRQDKAAKQIKPFSRAGKIQSDLRSGLITSDQADAAMKKTFGTTVNVGQSKFGPVPAGMELRTDPDTGAASMVPIPGGPVEKKIKADQKRADLAIKTDLNKAGVTRAAVAGIKEAFRTSILPVTGTLSTPQGLISGTAAGKVRSYVKTLQSGVALGAMLRLKKASATGATGFGAMNAKELDLLISDVGALNPNTTDPEIFMATVDRIDARWASVVDDIRRNVSPERIKELGLGNVINRLNDGQSAVPEAARIFDQNTIKSVPPEQRRIGDVINTPKGTFQWTVSGWEPVS